LNCAKIFEKLQHHRQWKNKNSFVWKMVF